MFCNQCGTPLQPDFNVCPKCGQAVAKSAAFAAVPQNPLERHLRTLGILWIVVGVLFVFPSIFLLGLGGFAHFPFSGADEMTRTLGPIFLSVVGFSFLIVAAGGVCVGWGLMQRAPWARIAAIVLGILALFHFPVGTALGIYTLWVLLSNDAAVQYQRMARAA